MFLPQKHLAALIHYSVQGAFTDTFHMGVIHVIKSQAEFLCKSETVYQKHWKLCYEVAIKQRPQLEIQNCFDFILWFFFDDIASVVCSFKYVYQKNSALSLFHKSLYLGNNVPIILWSIKHLFAFLFFLL